MHTAWLQSEDALQRRVAVRNIAVQPGGIARAQEDAGSDACVGGAYLVRFRTANGDEHEARGEYLEIVKPERVVMSFRWAYGGVEEEIGNISRVEMKLRAIGSGTELTFTHSRLQTEASRDSHNEGWAGALDKLERHFASSLS